MPELVKVHRKDQSVEDFTSKCLILLFWLISCISLISLIEIWSFCTNLLENYPSHKIDQLPPLRILSLCKDLLFLLDCCMDQQFVPISFVSIHALALFWPEWCKDPCLSLSIVSLVWIKHRQSSTSNAWKHTPVYGSPFNLSAFNL